MFSGRFGGLNAAVFLVSVCGGTVQLAAPYEVHRLGGSAAAMGGIGGILTGAYVGACLLLSLRVDRFDPKNLVRLGLALQAVMIMVLAVAPSLTFLLVAAGIYGLLPSLVWPPVMGWISTGHEGPSLNRRLGLFNLSWSTGMMLGPLVGGLLYEVHHALPLCCSTGLLLLGLAFVMRVPSPRGLQAQKASADAYSLGDVDAGQVAIFRPLARIAIFLAYVTVGIFRFQIPSLALRLHIRTALVGGVIMSLSVAMALTFCLLGRSHRWHYRFSVFFGAQAVLIASVLGLLLVQNWWQIALCLIVGGLCVGVTYNSNLFYGVSGGRDRARLMAIHELLLSCGFIVGSSGGGWVTDHIAPRAAYPICAALLAAGMIAQGLLLSQTRRFRAGYVPLSVN
jgi:MFS family permease